MHLKYFVILTDSFEMAAIFIGGSRGVPLACGPPPPPQQDPFLSFLSFSHTFSPKSVRVGGWRPPTGRRPPMGNPGSATDFGIFFDLLSFQIDSHRDLILHILTYYFTYIHKRNMRSLQTIF